MLEASIDKTVIETEEGEEYPALMDLSDLGDNWYMCRIQLEAKNEGEASFTASISGAAIFSCAFTVSGGSDILTSSYFSNSALLNQLQDMYPDGLTASDAAGEESLAIVIGKTDSGEWEISVSDINAVLTYFTGLTELTLNYPEGTAAVNLDELETYDGLNLIFDDQTVYTEIGLAEINMKTLVGAENLGRVIISDANCVYDSETGIVTLPEGEHSFSYDYRVMGSGVSEPVMHVSVRVPSYAQYYIQDNEPFMILREDIGEQLLSSYTLEAGTEYALAFGFYAYNMDNPAPTITVRDNKGILTKDAVIINQINESEDNEDLYVVRASLTLKNEGSYTITVSFGDYVLYTGTATVGPARSITLNEDKLTIDMCDYPEGVQLIATVVPEDQTVTWSSTNAHIASVSDNGLVTPLEKGETEIRASIDGKRAICCVEVTNKPYFYFNGSGFSGYLYDKPVLIKIVSFEKCIENGDFEITCTGGEAELVKVDSEYYVSFSSETTGTFTLSAKSEKFGINSQCTVTINAPWMNSFNYPNGGMLYLGDDPVAPNLSWSLSSELDFRKLEFASSNEAVATVDQSGNVTPVSAGSTVISASLKNCPGSDKTYTISVSQPSITIYVTSLTFETGDQARNISTGTNPSGMSLVWTSSDETVATVDGSGNVTPVGAGDCTITVSNEKYNVGVSCAVHVEQSEEEEEETTVYIDCDCETITISDVPTLTAGVSGEYSEDELTYHWKIVSSNPEDFFRYLSYEEGDDIAPNEFGISPFAEGTAVIKVTVSAGTGDEKEVIGEATYILLVEEEEEPEEPGISLSSTELTLDLCDETPLAWLYADLEDYYPEDYEVVWTSSDRSVATVENNEDTYTTVTAMGEGSCTVTVTVTCDDENYPPVLTASCDVTVSYSSEENIITYVNFDDELLEKLQELYPDGLSQREADKVTKLDLSESGIDNLDGLERFRNLEELNISNNGFTWLNMSTLALPKLKTLICNQTLTEQVRVIQGRIALEDIPGFYRCITDFLTISQETGILNDIDGRRILTLAEGYSEDTITYAYNTGFNDVNMNVTVPVDYTGISIITNTDSDRFYVRNTSGNGTLELNISYDYRDTYQWQVSSDEGRTYDDISQSNRNNLRVGGAQNYGKLYRCIIMRPGIGRIVTEPVKLIVIDNISVILQPKSYVGAEGDSVSLSVAVNTSVEETAPVTYQWYKKAPGATAYTQINNENSSELSFKLTRADSGASYYCVIKQGSEKVETAHVTATIDDNGSSSEGVLASVGGTVVIESGVSSRVLDYAEVFWQQSTDLGESWTDIPDENGLDLSFTVSADMNGDFYRCKIVDYQGVESFSAPVILNVRGELRIIKKPGTEVHLDALHVQNLSNIEVLAAGDGISYKSYIIYPDGTETLYSNKSRLFYTDNIRCHGMTIKFVVSCASGKQETVQTRIVFDNLAEYYNSYGKEWLLEQSPADDEAAKGGELVFSAQLGCSMSAKWQFSSDGTAWTDISSGNQTDKYSTTGTQSTLRLTASEAYVNSFVRCLFYDDFGNELYSDNAGISILPGYGISVAPTGFKEELVSAPEYAEPGTTVEITVHKGEYYYGYYALQSLVCSYDGTDYNITEQSGKYTFTMPEAPVTISAAYTFERGTMVINSTGIEVYFEGAEPVDSNKSCYSSADKVKFKPGDEVVFKLKTNSYKDRVKTVYLTYSYAESGNTTLYSTLLPDEHGRYSFVMPVGNVSLTVQLEESTKITTSVGSCQNGSLEVVSTYSAAGKVWYDIKATPDYGYRVDKFYVNGVETVLGTTYSNGELVHCGSTTKDVTITADFVIADYDLNIAWSGHYCEKSATVRFEVNGSEVTTARAGDPVIVYLTPFAGKSIRDLICSGLSVTQLSRTVYSFVMPDNDVTLSVHTGSAAQWYDDYQMVSVTVPGALKNVVSCKIDQGSNKLTLSITDNDSDAWAAYCADMDSGFITVNAYAIAVDGATRMTSGYSNKEYGSNNSSRVPDYNPQDAIPVSEGDTLSFPLKIAAVERNSDGSVTIVPLSDSAAESTRGVYWRFADESDTMIGATYFNWYLKPEVLEAFTVNPTHSAYPDAGRITWLCDNDSIQHSYEAGTVTVSPKNEYLYNVEIGSESDNIWEICTIQAPQGYTARAVTDTDNEGLCLIDGANVTIRKPVAPPYKLNCVTASTVYTITWESVEDTITERFVFDVSGKNSINEYWSPAEFSLSMDAAKLERNGIVYSGSDGEFTVSVQGDVIPGFEALDAYALISIPEGSVRYKYLKGYATDVYNKEFADTQKAALDRMKSKALPLNGQLTMSLFELEYNTLSGVTFAYSANLDTRFGIYEFYDADGALCGSAYILGKAGPFIFGETTVGVASLSAPVESPTLVGSTGSLITNYYPQDNNKMSYLLDLDTTAQIPYGGVTVYLPYSLTGMTYQELAGKTVTVYHYPKNADMETLQGVCEENGIKVVMTSFSPIVLDWSQALPYVVQVQSRISGTNSTVANVSGGGTCNAGGTLELTAEAKEESTGFVFSGWYENYTKGGAGKLISKELSFSYTPKADATLTAVYSKVSGTRFTLKVEAADGEYELKGRYTEGTEADTYSVSAGNLITLAYTGENFAYWENSSGKIISRSASVAITVGSNMILRAVLSDTVSSDSSAMVLFLSEYGQIMQATRVTADATEISIPAGPAKTGFSFEKWVIEKTGVEASLENIKAYLAEEELIHIYPAYREISKNFTVTVRFVNETLQPLPGKDTITQSVKISSSYRASAPDTCGDLKFLYWKSADGTIVTYNQNYTVYSVVDVSLYAVYGEAEAEAGRTVSITGADVSYDGSIGKYVLRFTEYYSLKESDTILEAGIVFTKDSEIGSDTEAFVLDAEGTFHYASTLSTSAGTFIENLRTATQGLTVYARAYILYKDKNGDMHTEYSSVRSLTASAADN